MFVYNIGDVMGITVLAIMITFMVGYLAFVVIAIAVKKLIRKIKGVINGKH